jgi:hypothetical protein
MSVVRNTCRCACCGRRIRRGRRGRRANGRIREPESRRERRYHGARIECLEAAARFMARHLHNALGIFYYHAAGCSAREKFACGCFAVNESTAEEAAA